MDLMRPAEAMEPALPEHGAGSAMRSTLYALLAVMLVAGAWVRFNSQIAAFVPVLGEGPAAAVANSLPGAGRVSGLLEAGLVPLAETQAAIAAMGLNAADAALLAQGVERRRLRLVRLPLLDITPVLPADSPGHAVEVSAAGYTRIVHLGRQPTTLTLPISTAGTVAFRNIGGDAAGIGAVTLSGLAELRGLAPGQQVRLGLVAQ
jgi:hypothetical protein